jgi:hypothetical protein
MDEVEAYLPIGIQIYIYQAIGHQAVFRTATCPIGIYPTPNQCFTHTGTVSPFWGSAGLSDPRLSDQNSS